jgi:hypothetical protein
MARLGGILAILVVLLAGCNAPPEEPAVASEPPAEPEPTDGIVRVLVVNDEYWPIAGAEVYLLELALNATTDDGGDAYFVHVPEGIYTVHARGKHYLPNKTIVHVAAGEIRKVGLSLQDRPHDLYLMDSRRESGFCLLGAPASPATPDAPCQSMPYANPPTVEFPMETGLVWALIEVEWNAHSSLASRMRFEIRILDDEPFADGSSTRVIEGGSPLRLTLDEKDITPGMTTRGHRLQVKALPAQGANATLVVGQPFDVFAQLVYYHPANQPDGVTRS